MKKQSPAAWYERTHLAQGVKNVSRLAKSGACWDAEDLYGKLRSIKASKRLKTATWTRMKKMIARCKRRAE